ncbi:MAG: RnfABCDGE type electron transport complex subunit B [Eubacteriales bacterium]|nr:RnfABCDGE type electron transport complex subunit B [Eubacteriales bacterium]
MSLLLMQTVFTAVLVVGVLALILGLIIVLIFKLFHIPSDEREAEILECLPGVNCGGCGYSGCPGYAKALASGADSDISKCAPGGKEVIDQLAAKLGLEAAAFVPKVAQVLCQGSCYYERQRYEYNGSESCASAAGLFAGPGACMYSCIGLGDCKRACHYEAIEIIDDLARINPERCIACGACVGACPKGIIQMMPKYTDLFQVRCSNPLPGKEVRGKCDIGCIGCRICVKKCPFDAISMHENRAVINQELCRHCGICKKNCPTGAITKGLINPEDEERLARVDRINEEEAEAARLIS